jgi:hypothetical protein
VVILRYAAHTHQLKLRILQGRSPGSGGKDYQGSGGRNEGGRYAVTSEAFGKGAYDEAEAPSSSKLDPWDDVSLDETVILNGA